MLAKEWYKYTCIVFEGDTKAENNENSIYVMRKWYFLLSSSNIVGRVNTWRKELKSNSLDIKRYRSLFDVKDRRSTSRSIVESHGSREAPPNRESCSSSKLLTSSAIGRHLARHCFIHACCTFLVYLVQSLLVSFYISTRYIVVSSLP